MKLFQTGYESAQWIHNVLSRIKFTAFNFFNINYGMLLGFVSALVTQLVIFIQFNAVQIK